MGRPAKPSAHSRGKSTCRYLSVRLTQTEGEELDALVKASGKTKADVIRERLFRKAS